VARHGVNGDEALLLKVLRMFRRDERDRAGRIRAALGRRDHGAAERHAHSLRGLAEGIGAAPLARLAGDVERAARARADAAAVAPALAALEDALARLCDGLDLYLPAETAAATGAARPAAAWRDELGRLAALMRACDGAAITVFAACAADFAASFGSWDAEAVQRGLDDLDFDGAHAALRWVAHQHGMEL
jgi:HPt (histidine-containing phosphotransfer) domain-containing protein